MPSQSHWSEALYAELQSISEEQVEVDHSVSPKRKNDKYYTIYDNVLDSKPKQNDQVRQEIESDFVSNTRTSANANSNKKEYDQNKENQKKGEKKYEIKDLPGRVGHANRLDKRRRSTSMNKKYTIGGSRGASSRQSDNQRNKQKSQKLSRTREPKNNPPKNNRGNRRDHNNDLSKSKSAANKPLKVPTLMKRIIISPKVPVLTTRGRIRRSVRELIEGTRGSEESPEDTHSSYISTADAANDALTIANDEDELQMEPIIEERSNEEPLYKVMVARPISSSSSLDGHTFSKESGISNASSSFKQTGALNALQEMNFSPISSSEIMHESQDGMSNASTSMDPAIHALNSFDALSISQEFLGTESQTDFTSRQSQSNSSMISSIVMNDEQSYMNLDTDTSSFAFSAHTSATSSMYQTKGLDRTAPSMSLGSIYDTDAKGGSGVYAYASSSSLGIDSGRSLKAEQKSQEVNESLSSSLAHFSNSPARDDEMKQNSSYLDPLSSPYLHISSESIHAEMPNTSIASRRDKWKEESLKNTFDRRQQWHASAAKRNVASDRQANFSCNDISVGQAVDREKLQQESSRIIDRRNQWHIDEMKRELETSRTTLEDTDALLSESFGNFTNRR